MLFQVNGLEISNLQKSSNDAIVKVDIIANHLTEDQEGETILKEAFNDETVNDFLEKGLIDFWHDSDDVEFTKEAQNAAIIGKPVGFRWENGKPVVTAQLTKTHPRVQEMLPHLEAGQPLFGASVAGSKMVLKATDSTGKEHRIIPKIKWNKLAIAPAPYVMNAAGGLNVKLSKANDISCEFPNFDNFLKNFHLLDKEEDLKKALMAPESAGALYDEPGGSITKQSLEKKPVNLTLSEQDGLDFIDTIIGIKEKRIPMRKAEFLDHFKKQEKEDFGHKSYGLIDKYFKLKKERS